MSEETGFIVGTALYNADHKVESLVTYDDLHHPNHRYRYAMTLSAHDENGHSRWLGLRWDGTWETMREAAMKIGDTVRRRDSHQVGTIVWIGGDVVGCVGQPVVASNAIDLIVMKTAD
jgi:hypothetical protein